MKINSKIVIVTSEFPPQPGGIGNHAYNLALYLSKENYKVKVITDVRSRFGIEENKFDEKLPFKVLRIKRSKLHFITYFKRLFIAYKRLKRTDIAIATGKFSLWNVAFCRLFLRFKSLAIVHGTEVNFKSYFLKTSINKALLRFDVIVAVSHYTKMLVEHLNKNVTVIPNGIDVNKWKGLINSSFEVKGRPILTTIGRISERKGQLQVIKHLPELIKSYPHLHYHCIGISVEVEECIETANKLGVLPYVTFHGSLDNEALFTILNQTDIFVMLSQETVSGDVEGFGIAILEANLLGIPSIGSKGCGIEDAIKHEYSGFLIDSRSTQEFLNAIHSISSKDDYRRNAIKWVQQFNWESIIKSYISVLQ